MLRSKAAKSNPGIVSHDYTSDKGGSAMKWTKKLLVLAGIFTLCLGFTLTAQAADRQFKKKTVIMKEGKSKILTLVNSTAFRKSPITTKILPCFPIPYREIQKSR